MGNAPIRFKGLIGSPHQFLWTEKQMHRLSADGGAAASCVVDTASADFANYNGKSVTLVRDPDGTPVSHTYTFASSTTAATARDEINAQSGFGGLASVLADGVTLRLQDVNGIQISYGTEGDFATIGLPAVKRTSAANKPYYHLPYKIGADRIDAISDPFAVADGTNQLALSIMVWRVKAAMSLSLVAVWDDSSTPWDYFSTFSFGGGTFTNDNVLSLGWAPPVDTSSGDTVIHSLGGSGAGLITIANINPRPAGFSEQHNVFKTLVPLPPGGSKAVRIIAAYATPASSPGPSQPPIVAVTGSWSFDP